MSNPTRNLPPPPPPPTRGPARAGGGTPTPFPQAPPTGPSPTERSALLNPPYTQQQQQQQAANKEAAHIRARAGVWTVLVVLFVGALVVLLGFSGWVNERWPGVVGRMPKDPVEAAGWVLDRAPVIDGHIDLPILVRAYYRNNATAVELDKKLEGHVDIPRLREGKVGGFFWSVYVSCPDKKKEGPDYLGASWRVRDTLEQIDVSKQLINKYRSVFSLSVSSSGITSAISKGKIASLLGVEGGHQLGTSLAVLRQYYELGVRYVTLTHTCHNPFADSAGYKWGDVEPRWGGLSKFGPALIAEMNRLGMLIDLSHTSDQTAIQALKLSKAPVMWSHSSARGVRDGPRNVPDEILELIGTEAGGEKDGEKGEGKKDAVLMVNFAPFFIADEESGEEATVEKVADHVEHIARVAGKKHVGIGSDFDGIGDVPKGLEDVSKYPALIAELIRRSNARSSGAPSTSNGTDNLVWTPADLAGLTGGNFLRVFKGVEKVARELKGDESVGIGQDVYWKRRDL